MLCHAPSDAFNRLRPTQLVFPYPDNHPALFAQCAVHLFIPLPIALYFISPILAIGVGQPALGWMAMPEATINKNRDLTLGENEIWLANHLKIPAPSGHPVYPKQVD
jgi:hypothetical protein